MDDVLAHGLGGGSDLPIPASYAVLGGAAALTISFTVLVLAWRTPRYENAGGGRPAPAWLTSVVDHPAFPRVLRALGLAVLAFSLWALLAGVDRPAENPVFGIVYVLLWVGLVPASILFGPVVRALSPARSIHAVLARLARVDPARGLRTFPERVGLWPAAVALVAFAWIELVSPDGTTLAAVGAWFAVYFVLTVGGALVFGDVWFARADPFEVYSTLVGHLSVWRRSPQGALEVVSPLRNLAGIPALPGLVAVVGVLLGSTAFDSYRESASWVRFTQDTTLDVTLLETLLLVAACAIVTAVFAAATAAPRPRPGVRRQEAPARLAHSVVPIVVGYMVAHYLTLLVETGQQTLILASDPVASGLNLFGTADREVNLWLSLHPTFLATVKVLAIVTGHVVGVIAAHDRAIALLPKRNETTGQLPLLLVMVAFTAGGLYLLFGL